MEKSKQLLEGFFLNHPPKRVKDTISTVTLEYCTESNDIPEDHRNLFRMLQELHEIATEFEAGGSHE